MKISIRLSLTFVLLCMVRPTGHAIADSQDTQPATQTAAVQYAVAFPVAPDLLITAAAPLGGATKIELLSPDGDPINARLVRSDETTGLALLRMTDQKMSFLPLAEDFKGGDVQCSALPKVCIFSPTVEMLSGTAPAPIAGWKVQLSKPPGLSGAPLLVSGKVVGVQLADAAVNENALPAATLTQLKTFLAADLPTAAGNASAASAMLQLTATKGGN